MAIKEVSFPEAKFSTTVYKVFDVSLPLNFNRDRVLRFVKMFDLHPDHGSGFLSFPTYNRCTGKSKLVYVWIQDSMKLSAFVIMLLMDFTGQKDLFIHATFFWLLRRSADI